MNNNNNNNQVTVRIINLEQATVVVDGKVVRDRPHYTFKKPVQVNMNNVLGGAAVIVPAPAAPVPAPVVGLGGAVVVNNNPFALNINNDNNGNNGNNGNVNTSDINILINGNLHRFQFPLHPNIHIATLNNTALPAPWKCTFFFDDSANIVISRDHPVAVGAAQAPAAGPVQQVAGVAPLRILPQHNVG